MAAAVLAVAINTTLAVAFVGQLGLPAIGLAIAVAAWTEALVLVFALRRREGPALQLEPLAGVLLRILAAAVVAGVVGYLVLQAVSAAIPAGPDVESLGAKAAILVQAVVVTLAGAAAYAAVAFALGVRELRTIVAILADLASRRGRS
jgi:peptidoglycan biosynthesis protein MviN/MurJ (putative lipid II flippase)